MTDEAAAVLATKVLQRAMKPAEYVPPYYDNIVETLARTVRGEGVERDVAELIELAGRDPSVVRAAREQLAGSSPSADAHKRTRAGWRLGAALEQACDVRERQSVAR